MNMRTPRKSSVIGTLILLTFLLGFALPFLTGRGTVKDSANATITNVAIFQSSPASIERKAQAITLIAVREVIKKHPNAVGKLQNAADDLQIIENASTVDAVALQEIIARLPPDTFNDPNTGLYIQAGILFFQDELGLLAAKNPEQLRSAAKGIRLGIEPFLPKAN